DRTINVVVSPDDLATRRREEEARGKEAFQPRRQRAISPALRAYAQFAASADRGAVRLLPE
ncbi:MAG: dihydroxy-acid dehydratase, partial [Desulfobulbaceae bacterium A2]